MLAGVGLFFNNSGNDKLLWRIDRMSGCSDNGAKIAAMPSMIVEENWGAQRKKFMVPVLLLLFCFVLFCGVLVVNGRWSVAGPRKSLDSWHGTEIIIICDVGGTSNDVSDVAEQF